MRFKDVETFVGDASATPALVSLDNLLTFPEGFEYYYGECYVAGVELVCRSLGVYRAESAPLEKGSSVHICTFVEPFIDVNSSEDNSDANGVGTFMQTDSNVYIEGECYINGTTGALNWRAHEDLVSTPGQGFNVPSLRILLPDPEAAKKALAAF